MFVALGDYGKLIEERICIRVIEPIYSVIGDEKRITAVFFD